MRFSFLATKKTQVIPWGERPKAHKQVPRPEEERVSDTPKPYSSLWRIAVFFLIVIALAYYAKSHWPAMAPVMAIGDGDDVNRVLAQSEDFFVDFRLDREKTETEQVDMLKQVIDDPNASKDTKEAAYAQYLSIVDIMGKQVKIEGILKAKGWDSLVFLSADSCTVVVKTKELDQKEVTQIGDAVKKISKTKLENITIIPVGN